MKVRVHQLNTKERVETLDALYTAAGSLRGRDAMKLFLRDLLSESERIMLGRRILIARLLLSDVGYDDIAAVLHVGTDTISRVHRTLLDQLPGYEDAIKAADEHVRERRFRAIYSAPSTLARLKKKYPLHFLLFPWPKKRT